MYSARSVKLVHEKCGFSVQHLASLISENSATVYYYDKGDVGDLQMKVQSEIAEALKTSPLYVTWWSANTECDISANCSGSVRLDDVPEACKDIGWSKSALSRRLQHLLRESGSTMADMSRALGISFTTITDWVHGRKYPRPENLERLANYFEVPLADLLNVGCVSHAPTDDQIRAAFFNGADEDLTEEEQKEMWEAAKSFIQFQIMQKKQKENK